MGLFDKIFTTTEPQLEDLTPEPDAPAFTFERQYVNSSTFRGYKRLNVSQYKEYGNPEANARALLNGDDVYNCVGRLITLKGIEGPGYRGVGVYIDQELFPMGTVWEKRDNPLFSYLYDGAITNLYLRVEASDPRPLVSLFIELPK